MSRQRSLRSSRQAYELVARSFLLGWSIPVDRLSGETLKSTDPWSRLIQKEASASPINKGRRQVSNFRIRPSSGVLEQYGIKATLVAPV